MAWSAGRQNLPLKNFYRSSVQTGLLGATGGVGATDDRGRCGSEAGWSAELRLPVVPDEAQARLVRDGS